jgi:hypothetical protein
MLVPHVSPRNQEINRFFAPTNFCGFLDGHVSGAVKTAWTFMREDAQAFRLAKIATNDRGGRDIVCSFPPSAK